MAATGATLVVLRHHRLSGLTIARARFILVGTRPWVPPGGRLRGYVVGFHQPDLDLHVQGHVRVVLPASSLVGIAGIRPLPAPRSATSTLRLIGTPLLLSRPAKPAAPVSAFSSAWPCRWRGWPWRSPLGPERGRSHRCLRRSSLRLRHQALRPGVSTPYSALGRHAGLVAVRRSPWPAPSRCAHPIQFGAGGVRSATDLTRPSWLGAIVLPSRRIQLARTHVQVTQKPPPRPRAHARRPGAQQHPRPSSCSHGDRRVVRHQRPGGRSRSTP